MIHLKQLEVWFVTGSQDLYGPDTLKKVAVHSQEIAQALDAAPAVPVKVVFKKVLTTPDAVSALARRRTTRPSVSVLLPGVTLSRLRRCGSTG